MGFTTMLPDVSTWEGGVHAASAFRQKAQTSAETIPSKGLCCEGSICENYQFGNPLKVSTVAAHLRVALG